MTDRPGHARPTDTNLPGDDGDDSPVALLPPDFDRSTRDNPTFVAVVLDPILVPPFPGSEPVFESGRFRRTAQVPRYHQNDQAMIWIGDNAVPIGSISPETLAAYQLNMVQAGLLKSGKYSPGVWDAASVKANESLLTQANTLGRTASWTLDSLARSLFAVTDTGGSGGGGGGGSLPPVIRITNSADLKAIFRQTARQQTGGVFVEDSQIDQMVTAFQDGERQFQQKALKGGEVVAPPSAQTFGEGEIEKSDPGGTVANRFQSMTRVLLSLVGEA